MNPGIFMSSRASYLVGFIATTLLLLSGFYFQYVEGLMPCPLCLLQRFTFMLLGIFFLIGIMFHRQLWCRLLIDAMSFLTSILGIALSGRQVWLQHFPPANAGECGVSLQYMVQALPFNELILKIFEGSAECSHRGWTFLTLNMAEWALICFIGFLGLSVYLICKEFKK